MKKGVCVLVKVRSWLAGVISEVIFREQILYNERVYLYSQPMTRKTNMRTDVLANTVPSSV